MARVRRNFTSGTISDNPLSNSATTVTSAEFATKLPAIASPDIVALVFDPLGTAGTPEIAYVTAHTGGATTATVLRGQETALGGGAARAHNQGIPWIVAETAGGMEDTGWITLSLSNGWVSYDTTYGPPAYRRLGSMVYIRGMAKSGTTTNGTVIATLPAGFRPSLTKVRLPTTSNELLAQVDVSSDGNIYIATGANAQFFSLNLPPFAVD